jgi:uncharacterized protein (TIGR00369 family)
MSNNIPENFHPFPKDGTFNDSFAPLYIKVSDEGPSVGLEVKSHHLNGIKICHGSVYMCLFDISFAGAVGFHIGKFAGTPTININIDYLASTKEGEWIYSEVECLKVTNTMGFVRGVIRSETEIKASGSGIFKLPKDIENAEGISVDEVKAIYNSK